MDKITHSGRVLVFDKKVQPLFRLFIFFTGLLPLLAPYEFFIKTRWESFMNPAFFLAALFSLVMVGVTGFILFVAVFAQSQHVAFDGYQSTLTYGWRDAIRGYRETSYRFREISDPEIEVHSLSDSPDSFDVYVKTNTGGKISFGDFSSNAEAQHYQEIVAEILSRSRR